MNIKSFKDYIAEKSELNEDFTTKNGILIKGKPNSNRELEDILNKNEALKDKFEETIRLAKSGDAVNLNTLEKELESDTEEDEASKTTTAQHNVLNNTEDNSSSENADDEEKEKSSDETENDKSSDNNNNDVKYFYRNKFSPIINSVSYKDQINELYEKCDIIKRTALSMGTIFNDTVGFKGTTNIAKAGLDVLNGLSLQHINNDLVDFYKNEFETSKETYKQSNEKIAIANDERGLLSKKNNTVERLKDVGVVKSDVDFTDTKSIEEGFKDTLKNTFRDIKNSLSSTTGLMYNQDKYNSGRIIGTLEGKDKSVFDIDTKKIADIYDNAKAKGDAIIKREQPAILKSIDSALDKIKVYKENEKYIGNEQDYIDAIEINMRRAYSGLLSLADMLKPILSEYKKTVNTIKLDVEKKTGNALKKSQEHDVRVALNKAQERAVKSEEKLSINKNEAELKRMFKLALLRKNAKFPEIFKAFSSNDKIIEAAKRIVESRGLDKVEGLTDNNDVNARILMVLYDFYNSNIEEELQKKRGGINKFDVYFNTWLDKEWGKARKSSRNEILKEIVNTAQEKKNVVSLSNLENGEGSHFGEMKKAANGSSAAKDFEGEEPKNIYDYAVAKAKKYEEK